VTILAAWIAAAHTGLAADLDRILGSPVFEGATLGVCVTRMDGSVVYERNGDRPLVPASCQKAYTAALCLYRLGAEYRPETKIWRTEYGAFVEATGDPGLSASQLRKARDELSIPKGATVRVREAYRPGHGPGWAWDDLPYDYAAQVSAFSADQCSFVAQATAGRLLPLDPALNIRVRRVAARGKWKVQYDPTRAAMTVSGRLPQAATDLEELAQPDPSAYAARLLGGRYEAAQEGPPDRPPDLTIQGAPIHALLKECCEESTNPSAEHFLFLGSEARDYAGAGREMRSFLETTVGVAPGSVEPVDGSGLSRRNRTSAEAMCQLFRWAASAGLSAELEEVLAAGGEGTLEKRLAGSSFVGKTGTMTGIVGLCGVLTDANGTKLAMTFLVNGSGAPASKVRHAQDEFVRTLEASNGSGRAVAVLAPFEGPGPARSRRDD